MPQNYNENIIKVLELAQEMIILSDRGDIARPDRTCGILFGVLRDSAYRLIKLAETERQIHKDKNMWDIQEDNYSNTI